MKKILKPEQLEEASYTSDFQNTPMEYEPYIEITFDFGYGSQYDGDRFKLHLCDEEIHHLLNIIKTHGSPEFKQHLAQSSLNPNLLKELL